MTDWSQVVQQHGPIVWKTVYRILNNEADAADCFQNTFVSALELSRGQGVRNWAGLLKRVATTRALDRLRQRRRDLSRREGLPEGLGTARSTDEPDRIAETTELGEQLRDALAHLDARQAEVFCLACLESLSYRQIAAQLGVTVSHVGVLLNRAKASLRERLRVYDPTRRSGPS